MLPDAFMVHACVLSEAICWWSQHVTTVWAGVRSWQSRLVEKSYPIRRETQSRFSFQV